MFTLNYNTKYFHYGYVYDGYWRVRNGNRCIHMYYVGKPTLQSGFNFDANQRLVIHFVWVDPNN